MTQYVSNYTPTSNLSGWTKTSGTLTATADGARWVSSGGEVRVEAGSPGNNNDVRLVAMKLRRNTSASTWPAKIFIYSDGLDGGMQVDLRDVDFPVGQWVTIPTIGVRNKVLEVGFGFPDIDAARVYIMGPESGTLDCTFAAVRVFDDNTNDATIDSTDAAYTYTAPTNTLSRTFSRTSGDECVATVKWTWDDGTTTTGPAAGSGQVSKSRAKTFPVAGIYAVKLESTMPPRAAYPGKADPIIAIPAAATVSSTQNVTVPTGPLEAHFAYETDFLNLVVDGSASFAPSLSPLDAWAYNWGDGDTSGWLTTPYASHTYAQAGTYNVTLSVKDNATNRTDTEVRAVVIVEAPNPDNYFVASRELLVVAFTPSIQDGTTYLWNFGDGTTSGTKEPTHTYANPGTYAVTLTVNGSLTTTQDVTVLDVYTPLGPLMDALRLEVAIPFPGTSYNRLPNPSGELGAWGWSTPVTNSYMTGSTTSHQSADKGIVGAKLIYRSSGAGTQVMYSTPVRVTVGQYASVQLQSPYVDGYYRATVEALDAAGAVLGSSATTGFQQASATAVVRTTPYLLPASTATARVRLNHYSNTSSGTPTVNKLFQFRRVMLATAATSAELTSLAYGEYANWHDLLGLTSEIDVAREGLDLGTLTATVLDSAYDPATDGRIRPGQGIRLRASTADASGNLQWQSIYTGTVKEAEVEYVPVKGATPGPKATRIKLSSTDAITTLTRVKEARGVAKIDELPELLEGAGVPFMVNGSTEQVPTAQVVGWNTNASVLDQVAITRDTDGGYAYVDRNNVLQVREPAYMPTAAVGVIDERAYSGIAASFKTADCINSVTIKWLRYSPAVGTAEPSVLEVPYGPYEDAASIDEWGLRTATYTMQGVENPVTIAAKAAAILAANSQPARMISEVDVPIRYQEDLVAGKALLDLYDLVRLGYARTSTDELARVTAIRHRIKATKGGGRWSMSLGFTADGTVAGPQLVPSAPQAGASGRPASARRASANQSIPNTTFTALTTNTDDGTSGGVTYAAGVFTVPRAGWYMVTARCGWIANATGVRFLYVKRGATYLVRWAGQGNSVGVNGAIPVLCDANDTIGIDVYHNAGAALSTDAGAGGVGYSVTYMESA